MKRATSTTSNTSKKIKKVEKPWIEVTKEEIDAIQLSDKNYVIVIPMGVYCDYIITGDGKTRNKFDDFYLKSMFAYSKKTGYYPQFAIDNPPGFKVPKLLFEHNFTDTHLHCLNYWLSDDLEEIVETGFLEKFNAIIELCEGVSDYMDFFSKMSKALGKKSKEKKLKNLQKIIIVFFVNFLWNFNKHFIYNRL